eukprot:3638_1
MSGYWCLIDCSWHKSNPYGKMRRRPEKVTLIPNRRSIIQMIALYYSHVTIITLQTQMQHTLNSLYKRLVAPLIHIRYTQPLPPVFWDTYRASSLTHAFVRRSFVMSLRKFG